MEISFLGKQYFINKAVLAVLAALLILGAGFFGYYLRQVYKPLEEPVIEKSVVNGENSNAALGEKNSEEEAEAEAEEKIKVYIVGCVNKPGVYTLNKGDVIEDAVRLASGATKEADLENINLAYPLTENTMLRIRPKASPAKEADKPTAKEKMNSGADIISDSLEAVVSDPERDAKNSGKSSLVNINTASQTELEGLPNVGPATAKAIVDYREKNGKFKKTTDLMKITGIKQKTFEKLKDFICI
ncbi:ComE operon protein 1 [Ruminiclostridium hungatei]|uniref:ComE operon protein 1 n=1 Tax=Ruminiclostridium hungatei TaxID=48256 RepID=A0A1V4SFZ4_RUMHU|nr:helix-hairpin-helix domain-containing protein [Ruminiclostridium hungatei]OPX42842.1 ComE operon protein 1 [Ruminiclostridium hungatei]